MENRSAESIISELKALKIHEISLIKELGQLADTRVRNGERNEYDPVTSVTPVIRDRVTSGNRPVTSVISIGDRVRIKNRVTKPASWDPRNKWVPSKAKHATVTRFYKGQVHFITDNGRSTWRVVNNLEKIG